MSTVKLMLGHKESVAPNSKPFFVTIKLEDEQREQIRSIVNKPISALISAPDE
jgi:hypothetical protein